MCASEFLKVSVFIVIIELSLLSCMQKMKKKKSKKSIYGASIIYLATSMGFLIKFVWFRAQQMPLCVSICWCVCGTSSIDDTCVSHLLRVLRSLYVRLCGNQSIKCARQLLPLTAKWEKMSAASHELWIYPCLYYAPPLPEPRPVPEHVDWNWNKSSARWNTRSNRCSGNTTISSFNWHRERTILRVLQD